MATKKSATARTKPTRHETDVSEPDFGAVELVLLNIQRGQVLLKKYVQNELDVSSEDEDEDENETPPDYSFRRLEPGETVYTGGTGESYDYAFMVSREEIHRKKVVTFVIEERGIHKPEDSIGEALGWVESNLRLASDRAPSDDQILCILNLLLHAPDTGPDTWVKTKDAKLRLELAGNPLIPSTALEQLAKQRSATVRLAITENSAAPTELRRRLLHELVDAVKPGVRVSVARNPITDIEDLKKLSTDNDQQVLIAVADNLSVSSAMRGKVYAKLVKSTDPAISMRLAKSPDAPASVFSKLLACTDEKVNAVLAENAAAPESVRSAALKRVSKSGDPELKLCVARNPLTPPSVLKALALEVDFRIVFRSLHASIAQNPATPGNVLESFAHSDDKGVLCGVAGNSNTPSLALLFLAKLKTKNADDGELIRSSVAENPATPAEALKILAKEKAWQIRMGIAKNNSTPDPILETLAKDKEYSVREELARRASAPTAALEILGKDQYDNIRMYVARNLSTPADVLIALAKDHYHAVRRDAASNPGFPKSALLPLMDDEDTGVRHAAEKSLARNAL